MAQTTITATPSHRIHTIATYIDTDGSEWEIRECPTCGHRDRIRWEPFKCVTLERGDKTAVHVQFKVPNHDQLRQMAGDEAFEKAVDHSLLTGEPLLSFGMAGQRAEVSIAGQVDSKAEG